MLHQAVVANRAIIQDIKNQIRASLPEIGSARLSEALAAAFGYRTSVAMKCAVERRASLMVFPSPAFATERLKAIGGMPLNLTDADFEAVLLRAFEAHVALPYGKDIMGEPPFLDPFLRLAAGIRDCADLPSVGFEDPFLNRLSGFLTFAAGIDDANATLSPGTFARLVDGIPLDGEGWMPGEDGAWLKTFVTDGPDWVLLVASNRVSVVRDGQTLFDGPCEVNSMRSFVQIMWREERPKRCSASALDKMIQKTTTEVMRLIDLPEDDVFAQLGTVLTNLAGEVDPGARL